MKNFLNEEFLNEEWRMKNNFKWRIYEFKKIFYLESVVERGFYAIGMGLVILGVFAVVYLLFGWKVTAAVAAGELLFFLWNLYEMKQASGG